MNKLMTTMMMASLISTSVVSHELTFSMKAVKKNQGKIYVALFKGEESYQNRNAHSSVIVDADNDIINVTFSHLPNGEYAIRYFHDLNDNGKLDVNLFGSPLEGIGFSNNAKPSYGPVGYDGAKFMLSKDLVNESTVIYGE